MRALPFLLIYTIPASVVIGWALGGWWTFLTVLQSYVLLPFIDHWAGTNPRNLDSAGEAVANRARLYRYLTWVMVPVLVALVLWAGTQVASGELSWVEIVGLTFSTGLATGGAGITTAHELTHQRRFERGLAGVLLALVHYMHFGIEHVRGHHVHVGTPRDPVTARPGESFYAFLPRAVAGSWTSAWAIEADRLRRKDLGLWSWHNKMLRYALISIALHGLAGLLWGWIGVAFFFAQGLFALLQLECINYVEHYGLYRREISPGVYEPQAAKHSWNANHRISNASLFNLPRHADHHLHAGRRYQILRHVDGAPQLPAGYSAMILLALVPPLWRRVMDPRAAAAMAG